MTMLEDIRDGLLHVPDTEDSVADSDTAPIYLNWGFTIYRTEYGGSSEQNWQALLANIRAQVAEELDVHREDDDQQETIDQLLNLFRIDFRSDATLLQGKSIDELRQLFLNPADTGDTRPPLNADAPTRPPQYGYFLLADTEVLGSPDSWVKCVQADYMAANYVPRNARVGGQRYFGWMKMTTRSLLELWNELAARALDSIAPETVGGMHLITWDGELD
ncbi:hypothetical protein CkaCkLH20_11381 [Colletotrichum karsti]|uniref:Uncharacterized protein n=1 Tax=Colletotrichum karsti TaxID=1095194 RepID=A0A9P6HUD4_9PEZI|nr:uncharacterized protein CkaCkLH20_11381 [Colletotrichum karsti]KAF9871212.1 hypothetical protein CkaCkLH20_11381 [Colletotrichum karsti]